MGLYWFRFVACWLALDILLEVELQDSQLTYFLSWKNRRLSQIYPFGGINWIIENDLDMKKAITEREREKEQIEQW